MGTIIKLSDTIREGGKERGQCNDCYLVVSNDIINYWPTEILGANPCNVDLEEITDVVAQIHPDIVQSCCAFGAAALGGAIMYRMAGHIPYNAFDDIVHWNDVDKLSFDEIANKIDEKWPNLMVPSWKV